MTKKIQFFFATLLMALTVSLSTMAEVVYEPLIVDSGFNRDVIAETSYTSNGTAYPSNCISYLQEAGTYYSMATQSVIEAVNTSLNFSASDIEISRESGWPEDGLINVVAEAKNDPLYKDVYWKMAPYNQPNVLTMRPHHTIGGTGTLRFKKIGCYNKVFFLLASAFEGSRPSSRNAYATIHYSDGSSSEEKVFEFAGLSGKDANDKTGHRVRMINIYEGSSGYRKNTSRNSSGQAYAAVFEMDVDETKLIESIEFENKIDNTSVMIFGVTGRTADVETPNDEAATVSNISQNSFEACWDAIANAASYRLDVAEDPDFQHILEDYNNLAVSGSTCQQVAGLIADNDYYWRVRAVDGEGGQSASSTPKRVKTEAEDGPKTESEESLTIEEDMTALLNTTTNLIVNRTLWKDGYYNTLCLPFSMTAEEIAASPIAGGQIYEFDYATVLGEAQLDIHVKDTDAIQAGMPYLIQWPNMGVTINNLLFEGVTITTDRGLTVGDEHEVQFVGNVALAAMENGNKNLLFLGANNTLYWPNTDKGMKGFRAHFEIPTSGAAAVKKGTPARIVTDTHIATDLDRTQQEKEQCTKILRDGHIYILREGVQYNVLGIKQ